MKVLFRDGTYDYIIENDILTYTMLDDIDITKVKHLDDVEILYYYLDKENNLKFPVYYEHGDRFITYLLGAYRVVIVIEYYTKDYTLVNLNLI